MTVLACSELQDLEDKAVKRSLQCFSNQLADAATTETAQRKLASEVAAEVSALEAAASKLSSRIATAMSSQGSAASSSAPPSVVWGQSVNGEKRQGAVAALRDQIGSVYAQLTTLSRQCAKVVDDHDRARVSWPAETENSLQIYDWIECFVIHILCMMLSIFRSIFG